MERGKCFLWLVFGSGLAAQAVILYNPTEWVFFIWLILCFCIFRGQGWARWIVVLILAAIGLLFTLLALGQFLFVLGAAHMFFFDREASQFLLAGLVFLVDAGILTFSESVGDFLAEQKGMRAVSDWG